MATPPNEVLGALTSHAAGTIEHDQIDAWIETLDWLRAALPEVVSAHARAIQWWICLEYTIPRRASRIDAVVLADDLILVLEFKSTKSDAAALRQAEDYAMELHDFHLESRERCIVPVVCSAKARRSPARPALLDNVATPSQTSPPALAQHLGGLYASFHTSTALPIDPLAWLNSAYLPTPTILEAARAIFTGHSIADISRSEASSEQLARTERAVHDVAARAHARGQRAICFITGVPGAGKTLAGLNVAYRSMHEGRATFLTGNAPLVKVLTEQLKRDARAHRVASPSATARAASSLVTNVGNWLSANADASRAPNEKLVVFDEAQRAWNSAQMNKKKRGTKSQPELVLEIMERHPDATVVALVGNGQEINDGETGLAEWGRVLANGHDSWHVALAPKLLYGGDDSIGSPLLSAEQRIDEARLSRVEDLHLSVSQRSFRSSVLTQWVEHVLANRPIEAALTMERLAHYPVVMTRELGSARDWLRSKRRGERRCGLLASSGARRLRPHGIWVSKDSDPVAWFLNELEDLRSSNFLEVAMSEYMVQGLELDWVGLGWDANLARRIDEGEWEVRRLSGSNWRTIRDSERRSHVINAYRVLLTRAREGMVIWIPHGDERDPTRAPRRYNAIWDYLTECGVRSIGSHHAE